MASRAKAALKEKKDDGAPEKDAPDTPDTPLPLLDLSDAAVRKMIKAAKKRGYVTHEEINSVLPPRRSIPSRSRTSSRCSTRWASTSSRPKRPRARSPQRKRHARSPRRKRATASSSRSRAATPAETKKSEPGERTDDPVRMYLREMGSVELLVARRRDRDREAHRGRPRGDDRGPVREPADLPGDHHLARRAQRRQGVPARHHRSRSDLCRARRQECPVDRAGRRRRKRRAPQGSRRRRSRRRRRPPPRRRSASSPIR